MTTRACLLLLTIVCLTNTGCFAGAAIATDLSEEHRLQGITAVTSKAGGQLMAHVRYACGAERAYEIPGVYRAVTITPSGGLPDPVDAVRRPRRAGDLGLVAWHRGEQVLHVLERRDGAWAWRPLKAPREAKHYTVGTGIAKGLLVTLGFAVDTAIIGSIAVFTAGVGLYLLPALKPFAIGMDRGGRKRRKPRESRWRPGRSERGLPRPARRRVLAARAPAFRSSRVTVQGDFPRPRATARIAGKLSELQVKNAGRERMVVHCQGPVSTRVEVAPGGVGTLHLLPGRYTVIAAQEGEAPLTGKLTVVAGWRWRSTVRARP